MSEWKDYRLDELVSFSSGGTPPKAKEEYWNGDIPWISASSMNGYEYSDSTLRVTEKGLLNGTRLAPKNALLLLVRGSILHQKIQVGITTKALSFNQDVKCLIVDERIIEPWYLLFWFKSQEKELLSKVESTGIGAGKLDTSVLKNLIVKVPPKSERYILIQIFKDLQNKIELNRKMNQTLEEMAQALFKSWFVDFDPVLDNAIAARKEVPEELQVLAKKRSLVAKELKLLHTNPELAAKFPDGFVFNEELGKWVPEGWEVKSLDEIAHYQNGLALQKFRPDNEDEEFLPVLKISHLKEGKTDSKEKARVDINPRCVVENGDVIFSWSASLIVDIWCGGKAALNQHLFKVTSKDFPKWFYYLYTKHHLDEFIRIARDKAVTMGHIKREHLSEAKCVFMDVDHLDQVSGHFEKLLARKVKTGIQTESLTKLRDTLLPQLISGKLRVPEAMLMVEKV